MLAWLKWNEHIESYAEDRYRIEEFEDGDTLRNIADKAGLGHIDTPIVPVGHANHLLHGSLTWSQLRAADSALAEQLQRKARDYGFPSSCLEDNATARGAFRPGQDGPNVALTTDEDSITWVWNRTTVTDHAGAFGEAFEGTAAAEQLRGH